MNNADYWIKSLNLSPHPEGGLFAETYRSTDVIPPLGLPKRYSTGAHAAATAIYFLLQAGEVSKFHRLQSDETWFYHAGSSLTLHLLWPDGAVETRKLGLQIEEQERPQWGIPHGVWFAAQSEAPRPAAYTLVSCVVAPGFEYADFEIAAREMLLAQYPQHRSLITQFT